MGQKGPISTAQPTSVMIEKTLVLLVREILVLLWRPMRHVGVEQVPIKCRYNRFSNSDRNLGPRGSSLAVGWESIRIISGDKKGFITYNEIVKLSKFFLLLAIDIHHFFYKKP